MALREKKAEAIRMRLQGASYSQIKAEVGVSKSTLSLWLRDHPLSDERIRELRADSPIRIERFRNTMHAKREGRLANVRKTVSEDLGVLSEREVLIAGLFLYWGEGGKTKPCTTTISNTDPAVLLFFLRWMEILGVPKSRLRIHIHLYTDMNSEAELRYWSDLLGLPLSAFRKPYVKRSNRTDLTYKQKFSHGTCNVIYDNRDTAEYVSEALEVIRLKFAGGVFL